MFNLGMMEILLVLAVAFLLWGQKYISYTDDGLRVDLPFFQSEPKQPDVSDLDVIDQDPGSDSSDQEIPLSPRNRSLRRKLLPTG